MKTIYSLSFAFLLLISALSAQDKTDQLTTRSDKQYSGKATGSVIQFQGDRGQHVVKSTPSYIGKSPETIDTLNYPLEGEYTYYVYAGGYVSGNNSFEDKAKANVFEYSNGCILKAVLIDFAYATSGSANIEIAAWDNAGDQESPGNKIASTFISLDDVFIDVLNEQTTYVEFEVPVVMSPTFYVGVILPSGQDTVALYTNVDGDSDPATAWEQWSNNQWFPYDDANSWGFKIAHAIFPIIDTDVALTASFAASPLAIYPGGTVTFFDGSIGNPISWDWIFEGGDPGVSALQNPSVTYSEEGLYDVTLVVGDGETYDTLTKTDLIWVTSEVSIQTDTLNFPLEGVYTLYEILNGGYICGNNLFNDLAKANYFNIYEDMKITGLLVDFVIAKGGNPNIDLVIWNNNGNGGVPGSPLATKSVELNTIKSNLANSLMTYVPIDPPITINHPFYAGFVLPTAAGDTLVVWSNADGNTNPGTAWDKWEDNSWVPLSDPTSWVMNISMAIHPIVEYQTGIMGMSAEVPIEAFPNPTAGHTKVGFAGIEDAHLIELMNLDGKKLESIPVQAGSKNMELDLSAYPKGVYFIRVTGQMSYGTLTIVLH